MQSGEGGVDAMEAGFVEGKGGRAEEGHRGGSRVVERG